MSKGGKMNKSSEASKLVWKEESRTQLLKTVVVDVMQTNSVSPDGRRNNYIVMDARDWVITIPVLGDSFLMVKQWRHGEKNLSIEFPGGVIEKNEKPEIGAARELKEETGFTARKLIKLGEMNPNPALMTNHVHFFAAVDLQKNDSQHLDNDEYVEYLQVSKEEVYKNLGSSEYQHALMGTAIAFFLRYEKSTGMTS